MKDAVANKNIILLWLEWHFVDATLFLIKAWRNILLFNLQFFSVSFLFRTLFAHWHRYRWYYRGGFNPSRYLEVALSNSISRILGAIMRVFLIFAAIVVEILILVAGALLLGLWLALPFLTFLIFILAYRLIS